MVRMATINSATAMTMAKQAKTASSIAVFTPRLPSLRLPEGYTYADGIEEISLADGNTDVVFTLVPLSAEATQPEG